MFIDNLFPGSPYGARVSLSRRSMIAIILTAFGVEGSAYSQRQVGGNQDVRQNEDAKGQSAIGRLECNGLTYLGSKWPQFHPASLILLPLP
jgi:hypothetical protein